MDDSATTVVEALPFPSVLVGPSGTLLAWSRSFPLLVDISRRRFTTLAKSEPIDFFLATFKSSDSNPAFPALMMALENGENIAPHEVECMTADGRKRTIWASARPIGQNMLLSLRDVTAEVRVQSEFRRMLSQERAQKEALEHLVAERTTQLAAALERVTTLAAQDSLTGLLNRRAFHEQAHMTISGPRRSTATLAIVDLDHFKSVNDTHVHPAGDKLIIAVADVLRRVVRANDVVGRVGGEEFAILLRDTDTRIGATILERVRSEIERRVVHHAGAAIAPTASIGAAMFPADGETFSTLYARADACLYEAKAAGRNCVRTPQRLGIQCMTQGSR